MTYCTKLSLELDQRQTQARNLEEVNRQLTLLLADKIAKELSQAGNASQTRSRMLGVLIEIEESLIRRGQSLAHPLSNLKEAITSSIYTHDPKNTFLESSTPPSAANEI